MVESLIGFKRRGLSKEYELAIVLITVLIVAYLFHWIRSICVQMLCIHKGYLEDCNIWQTCGDKDNKSCLDDFKKDGKIIALIEEKQPCSLMLIMNFIQNLIYTNLY